LEEELKTRQQAEEKLQEMNAELQAKESELKQFLEAMPVGVGVGMLDSQGQPYYYYMNRKGKELLCGKSSVKDSLPSVYQVYLAGTAQLYPATNIPILRALTGESCYVDDLEIHPGETIIPVEAWGSPIVNENHQVIYAITAFQDITERKRAEEERETFTKELFQETVS
jgi:PAS domain-containing protein